MPEGHLIHRFALAHQQAFAGAVVRITSPQGRFDARLLDGRRLCRVEAYGKHLFYWWEGEEILHVHLGLQGKFLPVNPDAPPLRQARVRMMAGAGVDLVAPRVCRLIGQQDRDRVVSRLGPDPLRPDFDPDALTSVVIGTSRPLGALLLDQTVIAGVGNVLRAEALFAAAIHPAHPGTGVPEAQLETLWSQLARMMRQGVADGRIITVHRPEGPAGSRPDQAGRFVYKQKQCQRCGTAVESWVLAGRTAYACPRDQPLPLSSGRDSVGAVVAAPPVENGDQTGQK